MLTWAAIVVSTVTKTTAAARCATCNPRESPRAVTVSSNVAAASEDQEGWSMNRFYNNAFPQHVGLRTSGSGRRAPGRGIAAERHASALGFSPQEIERLAATTIAQRGW